MKFLPRIVFSLVGNTALFWALHTHVFPGEFIVKGEWTGFIVLAAFFGLINFFVKPIVNLVTLPIRWLTLGLFQLAVNAGLIYLLEWKANYFQFMDTGLEIEGTWMTYLFVGILVSAANAILHWFED